MDTIEGILIEVWRAHIRLMRTQRRGADIEHSDRVDNIAGRGEGLENINKERTC